MFAMFKNLAMDCNLQKTLRVHPWKLGAALPCAATLLQAAIHAFKRFGLYLFLSTTLSAHAAAGKPQVLKWMIPKCR